MASKRTEDPWRGRQERLREALSARRLPALMVSSLPNIFYLTGFKGSAGLAVLGARELVLWVDPRYTLHARATARGAVVSETRGSLLEGAAAWLRKRRIPQTGFDDSQLSYRQVAELRAALGGKSRLKPAGGLIEEMRAVKDAGELGAIRSACRLTEEVFEEVRPMIRPGVREADLAAELEYRMKLKGAEGAAFEIIVASGPRGALPHARASSKLLEKKDLVIFDLGAIVSGYAADMTRTVYLGSPTRRARRLYQAVLEAQQRAVEVLRGGVLGKDVDAVARGVLRSYRLDRYFTHGTGHGVGLEIHELPRLARGVESPLPAGSVVTVEPGIYLEGYGGIRIEDTVAVGKQAPEPLTDASKAVWYTS